MIVYGLWYGGLGYSHGSIPEDIERFDSIEQAKRVLWTREHNTGRYPQSTYYCHRDNRPTYMPTVEGSSMTLYIDPYYGEPFAHLEIGPRGGVKKVNL